ncbi:MAG TPA: GGDEF domain-containing protein [Acidimicrobiales bacterium]|nr:GGDEF domain-containing protein [Acidimicrobiales bacterium]
MNANANQRSLLSARFRVAAATVVSDAAELVPSRTWVVARVDGEDLVVVCTAGGARTAAVGERLVLDTERDLRLPLTLPDGSTVGFVCALGGAGDDDAVAAARASRLAALLGAVAGAEWEADIQSRRADAATVKAQQVEVEALTDALTGVANRRAWDRALEAEERRRRRYGGDAAVVVVDLDDLKRINDGQGHLHGDLLLRLVASIIRQTSRESDLVARTGGDEFAILALNCDEQDLAHLVDRLRTALGEEGVSASVGGACRRETTGIAEAWAEADDVMFEDKARRKAGGAR